MEGYDKEVVCLTVKAYNDWIELLKGLGAKFVQRNESDYTGFCCRIWYNEI